MNSLQYIVGLALQYFQENVGFHSFSESHLFTPRRFIQVYSGLITDTNADNIENYFYDLPTAMKKRNRHVVPVGDGDGLRIISLPDLHQQAGLNASAMFIYPSKTILSSSESLTNDNVVSERVPLSIYVIADLDTEEGLSTLRAALLYSVSQVKISLPLTYLIWLLAPCKEFFFCKITPDFSSQSNNTNKRLRTPHSRVFFVFTPHI